MAEKTKSRTITIELVYETAPISKAHVNFSRFTRVGTDVFLDLGHLDDQQLIEKDVGTVRAFVTHRFGMSLQGFAQLKNNVDEIWQKIEAKELRQGSPKGE